MYLAIVVLLVSGRSLFDPLTPQVERDTGGSTRHAKSIGGNCAIPGTNGRAGVGGSCQDDEVTRRGLILFAALGVAWGIPYLLIKIAVGELDPAMVVLGRSAIGAVLLLPIAIFRKQLLPVLKRWKPLLVYTIVEIVVPWFFLSTAEQRLPSSTAGLLLAAIAREAATTPMPGRSLM